MRPIRSRGMIKTAKNFGIGAAESATGLAELIPGNTYAAKETQALEGAADPAYWPAKEMGQAGGVIAGTMAGSEALAGGKAAMSLAPAAEEEAAGFLSQLGSSVSRNATKGAVVGGAAGLDKPTGEEDTGKRYLEKGRAALEGAGSGAVIGGTVGAIPTVAGGIKSTFDTVTGRTAERSAEALRGDVAGEAQTAADKAKADMEQAHGKGVTTDELRRQAEEQKFQADQANAAADRISLEMSRNPTIDNVQLGQQVRKQANAIFTRLDAARNQQAGIPQIMARYGDQPIVDVQPRPARTWASN